MLTPQWGIILTPDTDKYPIARYLYFFIIKKPEGVVKLFIDWVLSKAGQRLVKEIDYVPLIVLP